MTVLMSMTISIYVIIVSMQLAGRTIRVNNWLYAMIDNDYSRSIRFAGNLEAYTLQPETKHLPPRTDHNGAGRAKKPTPEAICALLEVLPEGERSQGGFSCR